MTETQTQTQRSYRASSANLFAVCAGAAHGENHEVTLNPVDDAGTLGTAVHDGCAEIVRGRPADTGAIALQYGLDEAQKRDLIWLLAVATRFWAEYGTQFGEEPSVERELTAMDHSGHTDVLGADPPVARVLDWKTTRLEVINYQPQMMEYLWLVGHSPDSPIPSSFDCQYILVFLRDRTVEVSAVMDRQTVDDWHVEYMRRINEWDGKTYCPGGHCRYCPRLAHCPAQRAIIQQAMQSVTVDDLPVEDVVTLYERLRWAEAFCDTTIKAIKLRAEAEGGEIVADGRALTLQEQNRQKIRAREAWPVIMSRLTEAELAPAVTIGKTALLDAIGKKSPRGQKKAEKEALMAALEAANAVETNTFRVLRMVKAAPTATQKVIEGDTDHEDPETTS